MQALEFHVDPKKVRRLLFVGLALTLVSVALLLVPPPPDIRKIGWIGVALFGGLTLAMLWQLINGPRGWVLRFDEHGITNQRWKLGVLPWDQVRWVCVGTLKKQQSSLLKQRFLSFDVSPEVPVPDRMKKGAAILRVPPVTIWFDDLQPGVDEACKFIESNFREKLRQPQVFG